MILSLILPSLKKMTVGVVSIAKIEEMIAEKEENLIRYEEFIESIVQAKKMLRKVG